MVTFPNPILFTHAPERREADADDPVQPDGQHCDQRQVPEEGGHRLEHETGPKRHKVGAAQCNVEADAEAGLEQCGAQGVAGDQNVAGAMHGSVKAECE